MTRIEAEKKNEEKVRETLSCPSKDGDGVKTDNSDVSYTFLSNGILFVGGVPIIEETTK